MNNEILSVDELRALSTPIVEIPGFSGGATIKVRLKKPSLLRMAQEGEIPNHLIGIAKKMITGQDEGQKDSKDNASLLKEAGQMTELYCKACMVEPAYEEVKDILTDEQSDFIFSWAIGQVKDLDSFRTNKADGKHNSNEPAVPNKA